MGTRDMPVVAVDIGGTKIAAALVSSSGKILHRERALTMAAAGPSAVMERLFGVIGRVLNQTNLKPTDTEGICVAAAGPIDMSNGMITNAPNLPGWDAIPLREIIRDRFKVDSYLINDAKGNICAKSGILPGVIAGDQECCDVGPRQCGKCCSCLAKHGRLN